MMENSTYMPTSLASPALMVLASTAEGSQEAALRMQGTPAFPGQGMDSKDMHNNPFTASSFPMRSVYGQPDGFPSLPAHLLHLHSPFLPPGMDRGLSFINPTGSGAFRPVAAGSGSTTSSNSNADDRNGFHSAFMPTSGKAGKLEPGSFSHALSGDGSYSSSVCRSGSPMNLKEESSDKGSTSSLDLQERLTETPASDITDGTERSTPDEGRPLRRTKKRTLFDSQGSCCPVCGVTLRGGEVESHFIQEVEKLFKLSRVAKKPSKDSPQQTARSGNSSNKPKDSSSGDKNSPESRWESYHRVKANRQNRLSARAKGKRRKPLDEPTCPVCNERISGSPEELSSHVELCLRKREVGCDDDETVDVESETFEEYEWAGQTRIRATSLLQGGFSASGFQTSSSRNIDDQDIDLNVDGDDCDTYGQPQYNEADIIVCASDEPGEDRERQALRGALVGSQVPVRQPGSSRWTNNDDDSPCSHLNTYNNESDPSASPFQPNKVHNLSNASSSTLDTAVVIESLKSRLRDLEAQQQASESKFKCLICMGTYVMPLVSVSCWHVHCEECWLRTLGAKKLCPQCNMITTPQDLRGIYL